jgi:predicted PurR-regulated permease PerM
MIADVLQNKWVRAVALLGATVLATVVLYLLSSVLVPLFFAFIVAYIFDPVIDKIETYKISRVGSIVTLVVGIVLASIILPIIVLPSVIREAKSMTGNSASPQVQSESERKGEAESAPSTPEKDGDQPASENEAAKFRGEVAQKIEDWLELDQLVVALGWDKAYPVATDDDMVESSPMPADGASDDVPSDSPAELDGEIRSLAIVSNAVGSKISENAAELLQSLFPQWKAAGSSAIRMLSAVGDIFLSLFLFLGNFVLFAFVAIYLLKDYDHIVTYGDSLVPHRYRLKVRDIMGRIDTQLRSFLRGQFMVCCCLGTMYAIGFMVSGAPFALLLALFGALASFVPYLGLVLTIGPAVILTILAHGGIDGHVLGVLATFAIAQFLEGNFLTPKIVGSSVGLGPVWVILAIMIFSSALGFVGLLLAVPIAAVLKVLAEEGLRLYRESTFFVGESTESS